MIKFKYTLCGSLFTLLFFFQINFNKKKKKKKIFILHFFNQGIYLPDIIEQSYNI